MLPQGTGRLFIPLILAPPDGLGLGVGTESIIEKQKIGETEEAEEEDDEVREKDDEKGEIKRQS